MLVPSAIEPIFPNLHFGAVLSVVAALLLLATVPFAMPGDEFAGRGSFAILTLALLILAGLGLKDFDAIARVGLALVIAASVYSIVYRHLDPYGGGDGLRFYWPFAMAIAYWHWRKHPDVAPWQALSFVILPVLGFLSAVAAGRRAQTEAFESAQEQAAHDERKAAEAKVKAEGERAASEAYAARERAWREEEDKREAEARAKAESLKREKERREALLRQAKHERDDDERQALRNALDDNAHLTYKQRVKWQLRVLGGLYEATGALLNEGVPLRRLAERLELSMGHTLLALKSLEQSNLASVRSNDRHHYLNDDDDSAVGPWHEQTAQLTSKGKERVENMDKSGVKVRGKGHNVVVDSEKVVVDSQDVQLNTVNVRTDGDKPDLDAAFEALARLRDEIDALQVEPKYKRRSDDAIKTIEEELVDAVPSPETVQSSLERVTELMAEAGESYDTAKSWVQRFSEVTNAVGRLIPFLAGDGPG